MGRSGDMRFYEIFQSCFPKLPLGEEIFSELSQMERSTVFTCSEDGRIIGFVSFTENRIRLLCVLPEYRRRGFGAELLARAEERIFSEGYEEVCVGGSGLFIGAVEGSDAFFEKHGYRLGGRVAEMYGDSEKLKPAPLPENVRFGFFTGDPEELKKAVAAVEEDWVCYFDGEEVFCGFCGNRIASFCIVGADERCLLSDGVNKIGSIGCVGTVPAFRRRGIGLKMVSLAAEELKKRGCFKIFIHDTHVYDWYARLGFQPFLWVRKGEKKRV